MATFICLFLKIIRLFYFFCRMFKNLVQLKILYLLILHFIKIWILNILILLVKKLICILNIIKVFHIFLLLGRCCFFLLLNFYWRKKVLFIRDRKRINLINLLRISWIKRYSSYILIYLLLWLLLVSQILIINHWFLKIT